MAGQSAKPTPPDVMHPDGPAVGADKAAVRAVCPETAAWLNAMVAAFGRPQAVRVTADDGRVVYAVGRFSDEQREQSDAG